MDFEFAVMNRSGTDRGSSNDREVERDMRYVEVTDEYVHQGRKNIRVEKFLDVMSNAMYFPGIIVVEREYKEMSRCVTYVSSCVSREQNTREAHYTLHFILS